MVTFDPIETTAKTETKFEDKIEDLFNAGKGGAEFNLSPDFKF